MSAALVGVEADAGAVSGLIDGSLRLDPAIGLLVLGGADGSITAPFVAARVPELPLLVAEDAGRVHPYNIARRSASLHRLHGGRIGLLLRATDRALLGSAAHAISELWASWPESSLRFDKTGGVFADVADIRRVNTEGAFRIDGPLTVPLHPEDAPVLVLDGGAGDAMDAGVADLVLDERGLSLPGASEPLVVLVRAGRETWNERMRAVAELVASVAARGPDASAGSGSARRRLGLGPSRSRVQGARATAYPALRAGAR